MIHTTPARIARRRGYTGRRTARCLICKRFITRPSATCGWCGHDPLPHNTDPWSYDRAHGWE